MCLYEEVGMAISLQYWHTLVAQATSTLLFHKVIRQLGKHKYLQSEQTVTPVYSEKVPSGFSVNAYLCSLT